ncbi:MAG: ABC transporter permease [Bacteroidota bacterium]|nr:ABC transporter permease [Bacteroidota bacterium]
MIMNDTVDYNISETEPGSRVKPAFLRYHEIPPKEDDEFITKQQTKFLTKPKKYTFSKKVDAFLVEVYKVYKFFTLFFKESFRSPFHLRELINQCYEVGLKSLPLITLTGFIVGIVFTKQSRPSLEEFGAQSWLPSLMGIAIIKALGPLVTALICAGKVSSGIGAELGSMKVTEQIDAMEVSAVNPFKYLVITRVWATTLIIPVLVFYCSFVALLGSSINVNTNDSTSFLSFYQNAFLRISFIDFSESVFKSIIYGFTIGFVGCFKGYNADQGTRGVGKAANQAVVLAMFLVFIEEIMTVQIFNWFRAF